MTSSVALRGPFSVLSHNILLPLGIRGDREYRIVAPKRGITICDKITVAKPRKLLFMEGKFPFMVNSLVWTYSIPGFWPRQIPQSAPAHQLRFSCASHT